MGMRLAWDGNEASMGVGLAGMDVRNTTSRHVQM